MIGQSYLEVQLRDTEMMALLLHLEEIQKGWPDREKMVLRTGACRVARALRAELVYLGLIEVQP